MEFRILVTFIGLLCFLHPSTAFTLHTGSACLPKSFKISNLNFSSSSNFLLQPNGLLCGEDDFIITELNQINFLTVVDGVGSWKHDGINPKYFVSEFIQVLSEKFQALSFEALKNHETKNFLPNLIENSLNFLKNSENKFETNFGSCTIASISINLKNLKASAFHLGDATYMIIRDSKVLFKSEELRKRFNLPFQIGIPGNFANVDDLKFGKVEKFQLKVDDVIVIGSDGIFDNLFSDHVVDVVHHEFFRKLSEIRKENLKKSRKNSKKIKFLNYSKVGREIAKVLTFEAKQIGESNRRLWTPYAEDYSKYYGRKKGGGKNDDTTVVVGIISGD